MTNRAWRPACGLVAALLTSAGCSQHQVERANSSEVLCAAEALYMSRQPGLSRPDSDRLRKMVDRFRTMIEPVQREEASARIETLADRRGADALAIASDCDTLLAKASRPSRR